MALQMNVSGIRRNLKNIAHNYTDAQVKVREATSNDPWGPSSTLMSEIADLTYNVVAFSEIMQMIWKRLNDHGKNWRHVYKALVLLEYLIKTGTEKVADQCKENIFAIQTLNSFQYLEENKDMGINVREKAKLLVSLLKDDERLRNERVRALKAKERFAQSLSGIGSESDINSPSSPSFPNAYGTGSSRGERDPYGMPGSAPGGGMVPPQIVHNQLPSHAPLGERASNNSEFESARPQTVGEEELQLQLALAMSKEEAEQEESKRKSDDVRLQLAISQSESDYRDKPAEKDKSALSDLLDINFNPNGVGAGAPSSAMSPSNLSSSVVDPWGMPLGAANSPASTSPHHLGSQQPSKPPLIDVFEGHLISSTHNENSVPSLQDPWSSPASGPTSRVTSPPTANDPWAPVPSKSPEPTPIPEPVSDPWTPIASAHKNTPNDPWAPVVVSTEPKNTVDPFCPLPPSTSNGDVDEFSALSSRDKLLLHSESGDVFDLGEMSDNLPSHEDPTRPKSKSPATFLGENSNLVNLDNLVSKKTPVLGMDTSTTAVAAANTNYPNLNSLSINNNNNNNTFSMSLNNYNSTTGGQFGSPPVTSSPYNPFRSEDTLAPSPSFVAGANPFGGAQPANPFQAQQVPKPSLNQMRGQPFPSAADAAAAAAAAADGNTPWGHSPPAEGYQQSNEHPFSL